MAHMPPPPPPVPQQPPKRGMGTGAKIGLGCGIAAVVGFILMMGGCAVLILAAPEASDTDPAEPAPAADGGGGDGGDTEGAGDAEKSYTVGDTISHGPWDITVTSVEQGVAEIEDDFGVTEQASGQYVVLDIEATNTGDSGEYFEPGNQVLMDAAGSMFEYDIGATTGLESLEKVNPGTEVAGKIAYDVPEDFELDHLLVNGKTMMDDGVRVDLE